ncbi:MAG: dockerin type I repeat-containing protein [Ruminococcus sp.]|nr:dockerin type I repeat-containing protein [Ruminococcus sp.]
MKRILAIVLALVMVSSVVLCASAETAPLTYCGENGYTATKISHPETGVGEVDGLIEFNGENDRSQNYSWSSVGHGEYVYVGTCFGAIYQTLQIIAREKGLPFSELKLYLDAMFNGTLYTGDEGAAYTSARSVIVKINTSTYETSIVYGPEKVGGFRAATKLNDKLYFAATGATPYLLEIDPENNDATQIVCRSETPQSASISTGIRGLTTYNGMLVATMIGNNGAYMVASSNPSAGQDSFETICTQEDLLDYPAYHYMDSIFGGSIWDIIEYNGKLYITVVTGKNGNKQAFALFCGEPDENGEWSYDLIAGNEADGAEYPFGLGSDRSGAANLMVYDDYLYIGGYNDPMLALPDVLNGKFESLYRDLSSPVCLWRLDADNNIEMVAGEANEVFPEGPIGNMEAGFGSNMNQYVWRMENYNGQLYVGTFDITSLVHPIAQFTNGDIFKMTKEEWDSQIDYIKQVLDHLGLIPECDKDIAATGASLEIAALADDIDALEDLSEDFENADVTLEYRQQFYDALLEVKEQYIAVRDYLSAEAKERIDAFFANERVQNFGYFVGCLYYMSQSERGFDLLVSNDGVNFDVITRDGMGDPYNHGCRVFAITDNGLCIGTANPFFGTQVWLLDKNLMMGDVNMDGEVNIFDATEIQFNIAGMVELTDDQMFVADVNYDGEVNIFDVTTIQEFIAGYITEF